ncbi:hypothetical protein Tco_0734059 [Tanacetum coccineum]
MSIGSFMEVSVLNHYALVRKILGKQSKLQDEDAQNKSNIQLITKLIFEGVESVDKRGTLSLLNAACKKALNLLKKGLLIRGEAVEASKRRRSLLDHKIQQLSKGSSEGSGIIPEVPDEPKDNSIRSLRVLRIILVVLPEHLSDTKVLTMKMEILLEPTSNKLLVVGFNSLVHSLRALSTLRRSSLRMASAAAKPCQGDSSKFYLITCNLANPLVIRLCYDFQYPTPVNPKVIMEKPVTPSLQPPPIITVDLHLTKEMMMRMMVLLIVGN